MSLLKMLTAALLVVQMLFARWQQLYVVFCGMVVSVTETLEWHSTW